jgi:hypothetical protein
MKNVVTFIIVFLLPMSLFAQYEWKTTYLSRHKAWMGSAVSGNKAYFAGGNTPEGVTDRVEIFDVQKEIWTYDNISKAREFVEGISLGSKVVFAGGLDADQNIVNNIDIYDTITNKWTLAYLSVPRLVFSPVAAGNKIFLAGGQKYEPQTGYTSYDVIDVYDITTEKWTSLNLSEPRALLGAAALGDKVFFAGGVNFQDNIISDKVDIYDVKTGVWTFAKLSSPRFFLASSAIGNKVIFAGGLDETGPLNIVDVYDAATDSWSVEYLSVARAFEENDQNDGTLCGKSFFIGGMVRNETNYLSDYNTIDIFDPVSETWSTELLPFKLFAHSVVSVQDKLLIAGGATIVPGSPNFQGHNEVHIMTCKPSFTQDESKSEAILSLYPNPVSDELYVRFGEINVPTLLHFRVSDVFGNIWKEGDMFTNGLPVSTLGLPSGTYILELKDNTFYSTQKFVIRQ